MVTKQCHLVPYSESNHLIPNVNSLDNVQLKYEHKSYFFAKNGLKGHFPLMGFSGTFDML